MTAVSFGVQRGSATVSSGSGTGAGNVIITVGTSAPGGTSDIELRWNQTDQLGKNVTRKDLKLALKLFERAIQQGGATVDFTTGVIGPP